MAPGDPLARFLVDSAAERCGGLLAGDVLVVASKVISKAEKLLVNLEDVVPSKGRSGWRKGPGSMPGFWK